MSQEVKVYSPNEIATMWTMGAAMPTGFVSLSDFDRVSKELEECKAKLKIARDALEELIVHYSHCDFGEAYEEQARTALKQLEKVEG